MTTTAIESVFEQMLHQTGAQPPRYGRGKWVCPECRKPALSVDLARELFHCFRAGCSFSGGAGRLRALLGLHRDWVPRDAYLAERRSRLKAEREARTFLRVCGDVRLALADLLSDCAREAERAHGILAKNPADESAWQFLEFFYQNKRRIEASVLLLADAEIKTRRRWLEAGIQGREKILDEVLVAGGILGIDGKFLEVAA